MQTFLPYPSFSVSARVLDNKRLGKQRVEAKQIYLSLTETTYGWKNHPAVKMWRGHESSLAEYGWHICEEWIKRGFNDTLSPWFRDRYFGGSDPKWIGNHDFHRSHQSNLIRKDPTFYLPKFPNIPSDLPYIWPTP